MIHVTDRLPMRDVGNAESLTCDARHACQGTRDIENRYGPEQWCASLGSLQ